MTLDSVSNAITRKTTYRMMRVIPYPRDMWNFDNGTIMRDTRRLSARNPANTTSSSVSFSCKRRKKNLIFYSLKNTEKCLELDLTWSLSLLKMFSDHYQTRGIFLNWRINQRKHSSSAPDLKILTYNVLLSKTSPNLKIWWSTFNPQNIHD